ncbi:MAG TPA: glycosyltransferase family 4 protein [Alphaproteobacteria bacterium]|nr:glycosyltransferase family 4 protein [Alphaproteobacteria bacterium]
MRIAQVAPLTESVPPQGYGGTERVVSYLTEELVKLGHSVTLYASGDSVTSAELRACSQRALRLDPGIADPVRIYHESHERMMRRVKAEAAEFDFIHFHIGWHEFPYFIASTTPCVSTMHGRLDVPNFQKRLAQYRGFPLISISDDQRRPVPDANWVATIYHGQPDTLTVPGAAERGYLAFLGRISPEKRPDLAIQIAQKAGWPIRIAAKVDPVDKVYFETMIRPLLSLPGVEYIGEVGEADKMRFLAGAHALLFPIDWPEPFGLVMIEAMACGTPVIAFRRGSVPEVIENGVTGFVVATVDEAVQAVSRIGLLNRQTLRSVFRRRFSVMRMAADHVRVYESLIARQLARTEGYQTTDLVP